MSSPVRAILIVDDGVMLVRADGSQERHLAGGLPRPGCSHATATARHGGAPYIERDGQPVCRCGHVHGEHSLYWDDGKDRLHLGCSRCGCGDMSPAPRHA